MQKLYGLIGEHLGHSISPQIHGLISQKLGLDADYKLFEVSKQNSSNIVSAIKTLGISGVNVTMPYKMVVMPQLTSIAEEAEIIGAVNTVKIDGDDSFGYNTDYYGIEKTFEWMEFDPDGKSAFIMGNGGASKAVQALLRKKGISNICIATIEDDENMNISDLDKVEPHDIIINATPVGMYPDVDSCIVNKEILSRFKYAMDVIYNPFETKFIKMANELGLKSCGGLCMLVYQAIKAQEIWNNINIDNNIGIDIFNQVKDLL